MKEEEFRKYQISRDEKTLDGKIKRWKQIQPVTYGQQLPELIWDYLTTTDDMFIDGHFLGVILLCASIVEMSLSDRLVSRIQMAPKEIERFSMEQMTILAHRSGIITDQEKGTIDKLRKTRNALIHAKAGEITKMGKVWYEVPASNHSELLVRGLYLTPLSEGEGIAGDALKYLGFTRDLTFRFYGAQP
jgi:hypothetical protein